MEILFQDFRYALRVLRTNPGFTIVAILTLALGIGSNTAIFSVTNGLFLRPLPVPSPDQMVRIYPLQTDGGSEIVSYPNYRQLRYRLRSLELAAHQHTAISFGTGKGSTTLNAELVSGNYFQTFQVQALAGRILSPEDDQAGASPVALISHRLWNSHFHLDPAILGQKIYLNRHPFSVIGVLPKSFHGTYLTADADVWTSIAMHEQVRPRGIPLESPGWGWLSLTVRLKDGINIEKAQSELDQVAPQIQKDLPRYNDGLAFRVIKASALPESLSEELRKAVGFLTIVTGLVLLVVCANLAGALLPRVIARRRETAIRKSLGASQSRLVRQWLTESVLLAIFGGVAGVFAAIWFKEAFKLLLPPEWQLFMPVFSLDARVILFVFFISLLTGILCGLTPALQLRRPDMNAALKGETGGVPRYRLFGMFVASQTSISLVLLIVAALLLRSLLTSNAFNIGFDAKNVLVATVDTQRHSFTDEQGREFFDRLTARLKSLPMVRSVTFATVTPLGGARESQGFEIPGKQTASGKRIFSIATNSIGPDYFQTMGIPLRKGRDFTDQEIQGKTMPAAIINETMAKMFWPQQNPVGKNIRLSDGPELEIVGIANDIQYYSIGEDPQPYVYTTPATVFIGQMTMHIRTTGDPSKLAQTIIREIAAVDQNVAPYDVMPFLTLRWLQLFPLRALATVAGFLGMLALILTAIGIYGVLSYAVTQRTKEIGVRIALGATPGSILQLILSQGMTFVLIGAAAGLTGAFFVTRFLSFLLFQISPTDSISFLIVTALLAVIAILASVIPARRAMRIEPTITLRYE